MTNTNSNKPADTLYDGKIRATIWKNERESGTRYSVQLSRSYQDEAGNWHETDSFSATELLRVAHLATRAYDRLAELRKADRDTA